MPGAKLVALLDRTASLADQHSKRR